MIGMMARSGAGVFPPRRPGQTDGDLRKELNDRNAPRDSTILTRTELDIIREMISGKNIMTTLTRSAVRTRSVEAEEHKRRMQQYDEEQRLCGGNDKPLEQIEEEQQRRLNLERAKTLLDEQYDEVKAMNQIVDEARCIAVRNAQIRERELRKEEEMEYERKMEEMMTAEAEKAEKLYNEREEQQVVARKKTLAVIKAQLEQHDVERVRKLECFSTNGRP
ncbi:tumor suppressor [Trypanosoma brucei equiperdum]|uniref:Cilia- and flagella-associated protein 45 n=1 Tax=Trypanosoma brucei equiperdum TaxID=630700 RepID=A0A3L6L2R9_9TRYP|nr:tumor suppressor [Trypanosoma brucei equiperdum]